MIKKIIKYIFLLSMISSLLVIIIVPLIDGIDKKWIEPFNDTLQTTLFGYDMVKISEMAKKTLEHI